MSYDINNPQRATGFNVWGQSVPDWYPSDNNFGIEEPTPSLRGGTNYYTDRLSLERQRLGLTGGDPAMGSRALLRSALAYNQSGRMVAGGLGMVGAGGPMGQIGGGMQPVQGVTVQVAAPQFEPAQPQQAPVAEDRGPTFKVRATDKGGKDKEITDEIRDDAKEKLVEAGFSEDEAAATVEKAEAGAKGDRGRFTSALGALPKRREVPSTDAQGNPISEEQRAKMEAKAHAADQRDFGIWHAQRNLGMSGGQAGRFVDSVAFVPVTGEESGVLSLQRDTGSPGSLAGYKITEGSTLLGGFKKDEYVYFKDGRWYRDKTATQEIVGVSSRDTPPGENREKYKLRIGDDYNTVEYTGINDAGYEIYAARNIDGTPVTSGTSPAPARLYRGRDGKFYSLVVGTGGAPDKYHLRANLEYVPEEDRVYFGRVPRAPVDGLMADRRVYMNLLDREAVKYRERVEAAQKLSERIRKGRVDKFKEGWQALPPAVQAGMKVEYDEEGRVVKITLDEKDAATVADAFTPLTGGAADTNPPAKVDEKAFNALFGSLPGGTDAVGVEFNGERVHVGSNAYELVSERVKREEPGPLTIGDTAAPLMLTSPNAEALFAALDERTTTGMRTQVRHPDSIAFGSGGITLPKGKVTKGEWADIQRRLTEKYGKKPDGTNRQITFGTVSGYAVDVNVVHDEAGEIPETSALSGTLKGKIDAAKGSDDPREIKVKVRVDRTKVTNGINLSDRATQVTKKLAEEYRIPADRIHVEFVEVDTSVAYTPEESAALTKVLGTQDVDLNKLPNGGTATDVSGVVGTWNSNELTGPTPRLRVPYDEAMEYAADAAAKALAGRRKGLLGDRIKTLVEAWDHEEESGYWKGGIADLVSSTEFDRAVDKFTDGCDAFNDDVDTVAAHSPAVGQFRINSGSWASDGPIVAAVEDIARARGEFFAAQQKFMEDAKKAVDKAGLSAAMQDLEEAEKAYLAVIEAQKGNLPDSDDLVRGWTKEAEEKKAVAEKQNTEMLARIKKEQERFSPGLPA